MTSTTDYYHHQPLPGPRFIRVLQLQPNPSRLAELACSLKSVSLDDKPKYWALSYTWDAQAPSHAITCRDDSSTRRLNITPNCAAALQQLRDATEERTLWVDGICIDQSSIEERNVQVALMGEIYLDAERVVVWLGESDIATEQAIGLLKQIGDTSCADAIIRPGPNNTVTPSARNLARQKIHENARELTKDAISERDDKIGALFRRNWSQRMWTVQEAILPLGPKVMVHCGDCSISWLKLWMATEVLNAIRYQWGGIEPAIKLLRYCSKLMIRRRVPGAEKLMNRIPGHERDLQLSLLLMSCRPKLATDPKDKVYAMHGLISFLGLELPKPDYKKSLSDIYAEATASSIKNDKNLVSLYFVPSDARRDGLPSWVPDWSDPAWNESDPRYPDLSHRFAASGGSEPKWNFTPNPREIILYDKVLDTVIYRTDSFSGIQTPNISELMQRDGDGKIIVPQSLQKLHIAYKTLKDWVEVAYWTDSYPTGESVDEVLKTTLLSEYPKNNSSSAPGQFHEWLISMRSTEAELTSKAVPLAVRMGVTSLPQVDLRALFSTIVGSKTGGGLQVQMRQQVEENAPIELRTMLAMATERGGWGYHCSALTFSHKKSFFRTEGGYFGTAPDMFPGSLQSGDMIALIAGMAMPVVLRKVKGNLHLVSHCYVYGMMHGEAWERIRDQVEELRLV